MESFILLFKPCRAWLGRCLGLLVGVLLMTQHGWAQIYAINHENAPMFRYYDIIANKWTTKATPPTSLQSLAVYQGKVYATAINSTNFYLYDPVADTWTHKTSTPGSGISIVTAENYIYGVQAPYGQFFRYDPAANTWISLLPQNAALYPGSLAYDGGDYIYCGYSGANALTRYSISGNTWTALPTPPIATSSLVFKNGKIYFVGHSYDTFYSFDPVTSTYTQLASAVRNYTVIRGEGNYLYLLELPITVSQTISLRRYDISTNTWTNKAGLANDLWTGISTYEVAGCSLTGTVTTTPATCATVGGANANAVLTLTTHGGGATKVGYSTGSSYTGPDFATATAVTTAPMVLSNTLTNPSVPQPYTIRLFQDATCYKDVVATLAPTLCLNSDLGLSLSPAVQSGSKGELLTYTLTLTNSGPDVASNVKVDVKVPTNATLLTASPQLGTYSEATRKWEIGSLPVGSQTLTVTLKMN